ncbi:hypothetical protein AB0362_05395 [Rhodococcus sp. NPDC079359]|uniref:hypothetical protein n=1 Tax=Rhodococcus sp. NPDC079359 TaxID=3154961 RepID=UPI00344C8D1A
MAKYLMLKHYRGAPEPINSVPMDRWTPAEVHAHIQFMQDFAAELEATGEFVDAQALAPEGAWVSSGGEGRRRWARSIRPSRGTQRRPRTCARRPVICSVLPSCTRRRRRRRRRFPSGTI